MALWATPRFAPFLVGRAIVAGYRRGSFMQSCFIVSSSYGLFKTGLHGWTDRIEDAYRYSLLSQAANYIRLYAANQRPGLHVLQEIDVDGELDYIVIHPDEI